MSFKETVDQLLSQRKEIARQGGEAGVAKQHALKKLTARERLEALLDPGSFEELGIFAHHTSDSELMKGKSTPADGVICGFGKLDGRWAGVIAYDYTVMAGSMGKNGETKVARLRALVSERQVPLIWLLDSAGARIQEIAGTEFASTGALFFEQIQLSGVVPQVAAVMGPTAAGTSYIAGLADFVPMVKGIGTMALAGPTLVKAAIGETIDIESLGGSRVHTSISGVGTLECDDDRSCLNAVREYLGFFPSHFSAPLPIHPKKTPGRLNASILELIPPSSKRAYDMKTLVRWLADENRFFELQPEWAKNMLVGFVRIGGIPVGVVANQPLVLGGTVDINAADKAAHFIQSCDAFGIPLLFLHDCPGFMVGAQVEHAGIIRHGAKFLHTVGQCTVPKLSVVIRKSCGAGYYAMSGRGFQPNYIAAWPGAEIALMSAEGAAGIVGTTTSDPAAAAQFSASNGVIHAAQVMSIDDIIDPLDTARVLFSQLELLLPRHERERSQRTHKKHGVIPVWALKTRRSSRARSRAFWPPESNARTSLIRPKKSRRKPNAPTMRERPSRISTHANLTVARAGGRRFLERSKLRPTPSAPFC